MPGQAGHDKGGGVAFVTERVTRATKRAQIVAIVP